MTGAALLVVLTVLAATSSKSYDRIRKRDGTLVTGNIVSELERGFVFRTSADKTIVIPFTDVAEVTRGLPETPPAEPSPPAAPPQPTPARDAACSPFCREGFACVDGACRSPCNPPCDEWLECDASTRTCVDREAEAEQRQNAENAAAIAATEQRLDSLEQQISGLRIGILFEAAGAATLRPSGRTRLGIFGNYHVGRFDLRASLSADGLLTEGVSLWTADLGAAIGGVIGLDAHFNMPGRFPVLRRFALGLGARCGAFASEARVSCRGPGCVDGTFSRALVPAAYVGIRFIPVLFRAGDQRSLEIGIAGEVGHLTNPQAPVISAGLQAGWTFQ